ncbi:ABC transporter ATP-binding protein/permease [Prochlorococcus sp. AH-716-D22]|nr:ABC transporter ATP-binding protein/permease [Prochlorococcus sp. AH-716-D22]
MNNISLLTLYRIAYRYLSRKRKNQIFFITLIMLLNSFSELVSIAILIPFFSTLLNIEETYSEIPDFLKSTFLANNNKSFLISFVLLIIFICIISGIIRIISLYGSNKLSALIANELVTKTYTNILKQDYSFFLREEKSKIISVLTNDGVRFLIQLITPSLNFINYILFLLIMGSILVFFNWQISLSILFLVSIMYLSVSFYSKRIWKRESKKQSLVLQKIIQKLSMNLGSIEYLILYNLQKSTSSEFKKINYSLNNSLILTNYYSALPRVFLEYLMIIIFILLSLYLGYSNQLEKYLAFLITIIILAQKVLPLMQKIYESLSLISTTKDSFENIVNYLDDNQENIQITSVINNDTERILNFKKLIFENVYFKYQKDKIFNSISFNIEKGEKVAIIGDSGSGKTTLLRIILGLLYPQKGIIRVNNKELNFKEVLIRKSWQSIIGYVPQEVFLEKGSIRSNITFSDKSDKEHNKKIDQIIKTVSLENLIRKIGGIETFVKEGGVGLSGGEKQRIAIARALYKSNEMLVMDEPTSALDVKTKNKILKNILNLKGLTFICVLHDYDGLNEFDKIIKCSEKKIEIIEN